MIWSWKCCLMMVLYVAVRALNVNETKHYYRKAMVGSQIHLVCPVGTHFDRTMGSKSGVSIRWIQLQHIYNKTVTLGECDSESSSHDRGSWNDYIEQEITIPDDGCISGRIIIRLTDPGNSTYICELLEYGDSVKQTFYFHVFVNVAPPLCFVRVLPDSLHHSNGVLVDTICQQNTAPYDNKTDDLTVHGQNLYLIMNHESVTPNITHSYKIIVRRHLNSTNVTNEIMGFACGANNHTSACEFDQNSHIYPIGVTPIVNTVHESEDARFECFVGKGNVVNWNLSKLARDMNISGKMIHVRNVSLEDDGLSVFCESSLNGTTVSTEAILKVIQAPSHTETKTSLSNNQSISDVSNISGQSTANTSIFKTTVKYNIKRLVISVNVKVGVPLAIIVTFVIGIALYVRRRGSRRYVMSSSRNHVNQRSGAALDNGAQFRPLHRKPSVMSVVSLPLPQIPLEITGQYDRMFQKSLSAFSKDQLSGQPAEHHAVSVSVEGASALRLHKVALAMSPTSFQDKSSRPSTLQHALQLEKETIEQNILHHFHCHPQFSSGSAPSTSSQHHSASYDCNSVGNDDTNTMHYLDIEGKYQIIKETLNGSVSRTEFAASSHEFHGHSVQIPGQERRAGSETTEPTTAGHHAIDQDGVGEIINAHLVSTALYYILDTDRKDNNHDDADTSIGMHRPREYASDHATPISRLEATCDSVIAEECENKKCTCCCEEGYHVINTTRNASDLGEDCAASHTFSGQSTTIREPNGLTIIEDSPSNSAELTERDSDGVGKKTNDPSSSLYYTLYPDGDDSHETVISDVDEHCYYESYSGGSQHLYETSHEACCMRQSDETSGDSYLNAFYYTLESERSEPIIRNEKPCKRSIRVSLRKKLGLKKQHRHDRKTREQGKSDNAHTEDTCYEEIPYDTVA